MLRSAWRTLGGGPPSSHADEGLGAQGWTQTSARSSGVWGNLAMCSRVSPHLGDWISASVASPAHRLNLLQVLSCVPVPIGNKTPSGQNSAKESYSARVGSLRFGGHSGQTGPHAASSHLLGLCSQATATEQERRTRLSVSLSTHMAPMRNLCLQLDSGEREGRESPLQNNISATTSAEDLSIRSLVSSKHRRATCCCLASSLSISSP